MTWRDAPPTRRELHFGDRVVTCFAERPPHLDAMFRATVSARPWADAVVLGDRRVSYASLAEQVDRIASNLAALGIAAGDRVALSLVNRLEFLPLLLACARLGAISVPLNVRMRRPETLRAPIPTAAGRDARVPYGVAMVVALLVEAARLWRAA